MPYQFDLLRRHQSRNTLWNSLKRTVAPATTILSVAEAQDHLRVDDDEDYITRLIQAATDTIEGPYGAGLALITQTWALTLDDLPRHIRIPLSPTIAVTGITYVDAAGSTQTLSSSLYRVVTATSPATISALPNAVLPIPMFTPGAVTVTFTCGYGSASTNVPADLRQAALLIIGHMYENREAVTETNTFTVLPMGVEAVLNRYRPVPIS